MAITLRKVSATVSSVHSYQGRVASALVWVAIATLPFTSVLTINLGFPLKIYEVMLVFSIIVLVAKGRMTLYSKIKWPMMLLGIIWVISAVSLLVSILIIPQSIYSDLITRRFGSSMDGILALIYLLLAIAGFYLFSSYAMREPQKFADAWLIGALLCSVYSLCLIALGFIGVDPASIWSGNFQYIQLGGRLIVRNGTFLEGNYLALYLLLSCAIALQNRRRKMAILLIATVATTFSTVGFLGVLILLLLANSSFLPNLTRTSKLIFGICSSVALIIGVLLASQSDYFYTVITSKIIEGPDASISLPQRFDNAFVGFKMFLNYPLMGVGIGQYSYHFFDYTEYMTYMIGRSELLPASIANNVYIQILSEQGLFVFGAFVSFLVVTYRQLASSSLKSLQIGFLILVVALFAFPSYSYMFLWAYWAYVWGLSSVQNTKMANE